MRQPPEFLRRQKNQPAAQTAQQTAPPAQATPQAQTAQVAQPAINQNAKMSRAVQDQVMVALARILIKQGIAKVQAPQQGKQTHGATSGSTGSGYQGMAGSGAGLNVPIDPTRLATAMSKAGVDDYTYGDVMKVVGANDNITPDQLMDKLIQQHAHIDAKLYKALRSAASYT